MPLHRFAIGCVLLAVSQLSPGFGLAKGADARDYWLKTERKGTAYAYEHTTVAKLPDGKLRYDYLSHTKMDVVGINPQDIVETGSYVVDSELRPVSFEKRVKFQAKETHITGVRAGNKLMVTAQEKEGLPEKREIALGDAYFGVVLEELIARYADRKNFVLNIFDDSDFKINATQVEILKSGDDEIQASVKGRLFTSRYRIARDGQVREVRLAELGSRTYLTDAKDAQNIKTLHTDDGFTLTVRSKTPFPNVFKVSRAQVQVRWKKIPFAEFRLEDNRQKILQKNESGGKFEAVLEFTRPPTAAGDPAAPMPDAQAAVYLGEDEFIKPKDRAIRQQAAAIAGETKSPSEIVRKLLKWVNTNVVVDMIAETLTGPEVLQKKRGKCSEYAILFASLARAAGIPTRIALGEAYGTGAWMGHMWDEVWLGEWIAVDPSSGTFVAGPSHLKFIDSPTVEGTQGVRFKLVDNLQIEILDFQEETARTALKTGISGSTYVNATFACEISAPDDTWTMKEESEHGTAMLSMKPKKAGIHFALVFFAIPPGTPAGTILEGRLNVIGQMGRNYKLIEKGEADVAGRKAPSAIFSHGGEAGETIVNQNILLVDGSSGYLFALIAPQKEFAGLGPAFKKILASFDLIKQ